jgi:diguanylate cyclase (GGDEF)-like protein
MTYTLNKGPANRSRVRFKHLRDYVRAIVDTVREPLIVLSADLRVKMVNKSFCRTFQVSPAETGNQRLDALGNGQWKIPRLRRLLEEILSKNSEIHDFEVDHIFPSIGYRAMLINARRLDVPGRSKPLILLAIEDVTLRRQEEQVMSSLAESLENRSMTDELTGLRNRRGFSVLGSRFLEIAHQQGKKLFVVFMDLDGLKRINDTDGHGKGDETLKRMAEILVMTFRKSDILARLGGDEFAVVTLEHGRDNASRLIARLQANIQLHALRERYLPPITVSIGVAPSDPGNPCTIEELTHRADSLMYVEKRHKPRPMEETVKIQVSAA